jgi:hypothetical protein
MGRCARPGTQHQGQNFGDEHLRQQFLWKWLAFREEKRPANTWVGLPIAQEESHNGLGHYYRSPQQCSIRRTSLDQTKNAEDGCLVESRAVFTGERV